MKIIDNFLDKLSMYKLLVYGLSALSIYSLFLSLLKLNGLNFLNSLFTLLILLISGILFHFIFANIWKAPANLDSTLISLLIVFLIVAPMQNGADILNPQGYLLPIILSLLIVGSKYILQLNKVHIWNPAIFALVINALFLGGFNMWQVGSAYMFIPVSIFAFLILRKQKLCYLFSIYIFVALVVSLIINFSLDTIKLFFISGPSIFFASVMLTEPTTLPDSRNRKYIYTVFVALLANIPFSVSSFPELSTSPELALFFANIFSYFTSFRKRIFLKLVEKKDIGVNTFEFIFEPDQKVKFISGQYGELTVPHKSPDNRGMRRYFTIASAPQDKYVKFGIRFVDKNSSAVSSSFKTTLMNLKEGETILLNSISGEFILPKTKDENIVFIAGGIGITPFMSYVRSEQMQKEKRKMTLFNLNKTELDISCKEELRMCEYDGVKIVNVVGVYLTEETIKANVDVKENNKYYISGPVKMVEMYEDMLLKMGIPRSKIMTDYFPGYN